MRINQILMTSSLALLCSTGAWAVPDTFLYVGDLDEGGAPANGSFSVTFQMFNEATAGAVVFAETVASLVVVDGVLTHELGSSASDPLDDAELAAGELYLSVIVNGTTLEPRVPIRSVPFAARAADAESLGGQSLEAISSGVAIGDGAIQPRHLAGLTKLYRNNLACGFGVISLTTADSCLSTGAGCPSGQFTRCGSISGGGGGCEVPSEGSRNCTNTEIGSLVFAP